MNIKPYNLMLRARRGVSVVEALIALFLVGSVMVTLLTTLGRSLTAARRSTDELLVARALLTFCRDVDRARWSSQQISEQAELPEGCPVGTLQMTTRKPAQKSALAGSAQINVETFRASWGDGYTRELVRIVAHDELPSRPTASQATRSAS